MNALACRLALGLALAAGYSGRADWPTLHGNPQHTGYVAANLNPPWRLAWAVEFDGERLGTAMEPIVGEGRVFVATHRGNLYALDAPTGRALWRFAAHGPFLQSPAFGAGLVVAGSSDGVLYAVDARSGVLRWRQDVGYGGVAAAPVIGDQTVFIGTRRGDFQASDLRTGSVQWRTGIGAPVRQTAAWAGARLYVTAEDLRVRCLDVRTGKLIWTSEPLAGQSARDYYPIVVQTGGRTFIVVRTNPVINMVQRIARDRSALCRNAGVDDRSWQQLDAWIKSHAASGTAELCDHEQHIIQQYLAANRDARTFFVLDAADGRVTAPAPVLWIAGCQGVGAMPALTADGRLLVYYRSAYGHWSLGVAPLVALGLLDLAQNRITPLPQINGAQPPWNTFWGTTDESQNFDVIGDQAFLVHQGTLSTYDLRTSQLRPVWGERDTFGGFRNPPWARNEWHGPGRGGIAIADGRVVWLTGSRVLCLAAGQSGKNAEVTTVRAEDLAAKPAPLPPLPRVPKMRAWLAQATREVLDRQWAPLVTEPGLAGRSFSFDQSGDYFEAFARAYRQVPSSLRLQVKSFLADQWRRHPPYTRSAWYSLKDGQRREPFWVPEDVLSRVGQDRSPLPFGNMHAVWLYAQELAEERTVLAAWPQLQSAFAEFMASGWTLAADKGDLYANRYLASLLAFAELAKRAGDNDAAQRAAVKATETTDALAAWWRRAAERATLTSFRGASELDPFIGAGDALSFRIAPHRHKVALFADLTPEVATLMRSRVPGAVEQVWRTFSRLYCTWSLVGEERQIHFGENFQDPPELARDSFAALAWLRRASADELARAIDLPCGRADLYYIGKLTLALERSAAEREPRGDSRKATVLRE